MTTTPKLIVRTQFEAENNFIPLCNEGDSAVLVCDATRVVEVRLEAVSFGSNPNSSVQPAFALIAQPWDAREFSLCVNGVYYFQGPVSLFPGDKLCLCANGAEVDENLFEILSAESYYAKFGDRKSILLSLSPDEVEALEAYHNSGKSELYPPTRREKEKEKRLERTKLLSKWYNYYAFRYGLSDDVTAEQLLHPAEVRTRQKLGKGASCGGGAAGGSGGGGGDPPSGIVSSSSVLLHHEHNVPSTMFVSHVTVPEDLVRAVLQDEADEAERAGDPNTRRRRRSSIYHSAAADEEQAHRCLTHKNCCVCDLARKGIHIADGEDITLTRLRERVLLRFPNTIVEPEDDGEKQKISTDANEAEEDASKGKSPRTSEDDDEASEKSVSRTKEIKEVPITSPWGDYHGYRTNFNNERRASHPIPQQPNSSNTNDGTATGAAEEDQPEDLEEVPSPHETELRVIFDRLQKLEAMLRPPMYT